MNKKAKQVLEERKQYYKMLLPKSMSLEEKIDELYDIPSEDLIVLMSQFQDDEDYEICLAIKSVLEERKIS